jgi:DNA replication initiation complex subunit (GINS family)
VRSPDLPEPTLDYVKRHLDFEERSNEIAPIPDDFYTRVSAYAQGLRRSSSSSNSDITNKLISKQSEMIAGMVNELIRRRMAKASSQGQASHLLPEERFAYSAADTLDRRIKALVEAAASGRPSFIEHARRTEMNRSTTLRFLKPITEIIGIDMRHYGPFNPDDLASLPAANAELLVMNGEAVAVQTRDDV